MKIPCKDIKMTDYISAEKHFKDKDTIFWGNCQIEAEYPSSGLERYSLKGCKDVDVWVNNNLGIMKFGCSVMYFVKGHNFIYSKEEFAEGINLIGNLLHIDLWDAFLNELEFGTIISTPKAAKQYIKNHSPGKGLKDDKISPYFRQWKAKNNIRLKMYDAGKNIQHKQGKSMKAIIKEEGWNPENNYLKLEAHYFKPEKHFNKGNWITIADLMTPELTKSMQDDLFNLYKRLQPMKSLINPNNKKDLSSIDIALQTLIEKGINEGKSIQATKKEIYEKINSFPDEVLCQTDKNSRKATIKKSLDKLQESEVSEFDISELIKESFIKPLQQ